MTNVTYLDLKYGVLDDFILCQVDAIAQQSNCVTCRPWGLAKGIADKLPYGCSYQDRTLLSNNTCVIADRATPGTIDVRYPTEGYEDSPYVINMFAQWEKSKPFRYYTNPSPIDSYQSRIEWFQDCLEAIPNIKPPPESIAFPYQIGCGLAGGDWKIYEAMLLEFAEQTNIKIYICKLYTA